MSNAKLSGPPLFTEGHLTTLVSILMALVLVQIAVITYWFTLANDANGDAGRDAQFFALQGVGQRTIGTLRAGYDEGSAYNRWLELNTLARIDDQKGNTAEANRLRAARDRISKLSPLLQPPYFNSGKDAAPNSISYEAATYVRDSTALFERFENQYRLKVQWSDKSSAYTVQLTLLAVALFMFGVIATSPRRIKFLFLAIGVGLCAVVAGWMLVTYFTPVVGLPDAAIDAYANGAAELYQYDSAKAIAAYDQAIGLAPNYANAYRDRATAKYLENDVAGAATDLAAARANGDNTTDTTSSLGFLNYVLGKFDTANALNREALNGARNEIWVRFNYAIGLLAAGSDAQAQQEYNTALQQAAQLVATTRAQGKQPPASLWYEFDQAALDLQALADCASKQLCVGTPPYSALKNPNDMARAAQALVTQLKENSVALEYTGKPPVAHGTVTVQPFVFTRQPVSSLDQIQASNVFTATDEPIYMGVRFQGIPDGAQILLKLYVDGYEDERLRVTHQYESAGRAGGVGEAILPITTGSVPLTAGSYQVEMYVDSELVQTGDFEVTGAAK